MSQKAYFKAPKIALIAGVVTAAAFLVFGVFFFTVLAKEGSTVGMVFMVLWILVVTLIGGVQVYNLANYKNDEKNTAGEIVFADPASDNGFAEKLRKLDSLKKDGLISEDEFKKKRAEIMDKKW